MSTKEQLKLAEAKLSLFELYLYDTTHDVNPIVNRNHGIVVRLYRVTSASGGYIVINDNAITYLDDECQRLREPATEYELYVRDLVFELRSLRNVMLANSDTEES